MTHGITADSMTHGILVVSMIHGTLVMADTTEDGTAHGTAICPHTTADGTADGIHTGVIITTIIQLLRFTTKTAGREADARQGRNEYSQAGFRQEEASEPAAEYPGLGLQQQAEYQQAPPPPADEQKRPA